MAFDQSMDDQAVPFDPDAPLDDPDAAPDEPVDPPEEEPSLEALDDEARVIAERLIARERENALAPFREIGWDTNREGRPLIADAAKLAEYAGPIMQRPQPAQPTAQPPQPVAQAPAAVEAPPEFDPMTATADDYRQLAQWEARQALAPVLEENRRLLALMQQRSASEAVQNVRSVVERRLAPLAPMMEHPDFAAEYEREIAQSPPEWLASPEYVSGVAAVVLSRLDPARMPAPKEAPRDPQGRYMTREQQDAQLRNQAARQSLAQAPPARGGGVTRNAPDPAAEMGARIFQHIGRQLSPKEARGWQATPDAYERAGIQDYDTWLQETERAEAARGNGARRR